MHRFGNRKTQIRERIYTNLTTKKCVCNETNTRIRWNKCTYLIMWKCVLGYGNTHFWLCKNTSTMNRYPTPAECSQPIHGMFVAVFQFVRHIIIIYVTHHRKPLATCLFRDGYAFWKQKPPFCTSKTILLYTKNPLFGVQKGGFCSVKKAGLHNKNEQPEKPLPVATIPNTHTPPHNNTTHSAHAYA